MSRRLSYKPRFSERFTLIQTKILEYDIREAEFARAERQMLLILAFFTILLLFSVDVARAFSCQASDRADSGLAEGTRESLAAILIIKSPNRRKTSWACWLRSFNAMTTQLRDNRSQIDQFTRNLQQAVQELERRAAVDGNRAGGTFPLA